MKGVGGSRSRRFRQAPGQMTGRSARSYDRAFLSSMGAPRSAARPGLIRRAWGFVRRLLRRGRRTAPATPAPVERRSGLYPCASFQSTCTKPVSDDRIFCPEHRAQSLARAKARRLRKENRARAQLIRRKYR